MSDTIPWYFVHFYIYLRSFYILYFHLKLYDYLSSLPLLVYDLSFLIFPYLPFPFLFRFAKIQPNFLQSVIIFVCNYPSNINSWTNQKLILRYYAISFNPPCKYLKEAVIIFNKYPTAWLKSLSHFSYDMQSQYLIQNSQLNKETKWILRVLKMLVQKP